MSDKFQDKFSMFLFLDIWLKTSMAVADIHVALSVQIWLFWVGDH